jgi:hypothetical protein
MFILSSPGLPQFIFNIVSLPVVHNYSPDQARGWYLALLLTSLE